MPLLIAIIGIAITAYIWMNRARRGAEMARDIIDIAGEVKNAPRKFRFRRQANQHPVDSIEEPDLAIGALAVAFLELDDLPTAEARTKTEHALRKHLSLDAEAGQEINVLGRWFVEECKGPAPAFPRLAKKLKSLDGNASFNRLMAVLSDISAATGGTPSLRQSEALEDLARIFRLQ